MPVRRKLGTATATAGVGRWGRSRESSADEPEPMLTGTWTDDWDRDADTGSEPISKGDRD